MGIKQKLVDLYVDKVKGSGSLPEVESSSEPVTHEWWDQVLSKYVRPDGTFNYEGLAEDRQRFDQYLQLLREHHPNDTNWSPEAQMAYWINAYNAFTIELILENLPVTSIRKIDGAWKKKFILIEGHPYSLDDIEHLILRKQNEPRIHFAINCASGSCPVVRPEAFKPEKLSDQLDEQTRHFVNDESRNTINDNGQVELSKIFSWYQVDFGGEDKVKEFIRGYTDKNIADEQSLDYKDYDWELND